MSIIDRLSIIIVDNINLVITDSKVVRGSLLIKFILVLLKSIVVITIITLVVGLLLPQQYKVTKTIVIDASPIQIKNLITDFEQWPSWSPWQKITPNIKFSLGNPSAGVGAHQFWQNRWGSGEMTITSVTDNEIHINVLFNQEHIVNTRIDLTKVQYGTQIESSLYGEVNTPIIGGYLALLNKYILANSIKIGLNNLKTTIQINAIEFNESQHDHKSSPSEN